MSLATVQVCSGTMLAFWLLHAGDPPPRGSGNIPTGLRRLDHRGARGLALDGQPHPVEEIDGLK
ncbi:MAG: hypothetical protein OHK0015_05990 [Chloroflexi bacterium OHK40]